MSLCNNCPRYCGVDRKLRVGLCGVGEDIFLARAGLHFGEEPCISGKNGSGTIFFSGCSLKCVMCQNYEISHLGHGKAVDKVRFIGIMRELEAKGAHNINFVTPTHYFRQIEEILKEFRPNIPLVYNSGGYDTEENIEKDIFDIYLFDLKFFSSEKSRRYAKCDDYFKKASAAVKKAIDLKGKPVFDADGIMRSGVIVRHMILPQNTGESINIINWLSENAPDIVFSLMSQYTPMYRSGEYPEIDRKITKREYNKVLDVCYDKKFCETYVQKLSSATKEMIPDFDLAGI